MFSDQSQFTVAVFSRSFQLNLYSHSHEKVTYIKALAVIFTAVCSALNSACIAYVLPLFANDGTGTADARR